MGLSPSLAQINEVCIVEYESFTELCRSSSDLLKTYDVDRVGDRGNRGDNVDDKVRGDDSSSDRFVEAISNDTRPQ